MRQELFFRILFSGFVSLIIAWTVYYDAKNDSRSFQTGGLKLRPHLSGSLLPSILLILTAFSLIYSGARQTAASAMTVFLNIFLPITIYYLILLPALPFLRKRICARTCAALWIVPNYLYITLYAQMELPKPELVIAVPGNLIWIIFFLWLLGFLVVLLWKTAEHLSFRHRILADSAPVTDPEILAVWKRLITESQIRISDIPLATSRSVKTPLSIGLFRSTIQVVLPAKTYGPDELELILRHELTHIVREDAWSKYFLVFCTAICWFNPLMWIAMKTCAQDLELSCDETVLQNADDGTRKKYASVLLDTAGDERGFTTCLSASAESMRYRLKNIVKPVKRRSGALAAGLVFFVLCMAGGYVALAYGGESGAEVIYPSGDCTQCKLRYITMTDGGRQTEYAAADEKAFHEYLSGLTLLDLTGNYSFSGDEKQVTFLMDIPDGTLGVILYDHIIKVSPYLEQASYYYIKDGINWDEIDTLLVPLPALNIHLTREGEPQGEDFSALLNRAWKTADGEKSLVYDPGYPEDTVNGLFGYDPFDEAMFSFSKELAAPCSVLIESWDRSENYTVTQTDMTQPFVLELPESRAHYTVYASFYEPDIGLCEAEFLFDIGDVGE